MAQEYAAAHSMDTEWFAVDRDGHVAIFDTGENGHAPEGIEPGDLDASYDLLEWHDPQATAEPLRYPGGTIPLELAEVGVFYFYYELFNEDAFTTVWPWPRLTADGVPFYTRFGLHFHSFAGPYARALLPATFLHVDQLPPELRRRAKRFRLSVSFAESEFIQPAEHLQCRGWWHDRCLAYRRADGKTLRPWFNKKHKFGPFIRDFLAENPRRAEWFAFDWSTGDFPGPPG